MMISEAQLRSDAELAALRKRLLVKLLPKLAGSTLPLPSELLRG